MAVSGINGNIKLSGTAVAQITSWDISPAAKMLPYTVFTDTWESNVPSIKNASVKASGYYIGTDTNGQTALMTAFLNNTVCALELDIDGTHYWTCNAYLKTIPQKVQVDALVTQDYEFAVDGALTWH